MNGAQMTAVADNYEFDDPSGSIRDQEAERKRILTATDIRVGYGVRTTAGVMAGSHSVRAAGTVIRRDVPESSIIGGVPGKVLRMRDERRH